MRARAAAELAVVVPTFNEAANVAELVRRLDHALTGRHWEIVFVDDDSADGTADAVRALALADPRVRCLQRIGRRGLARAVVEGVLATAAPVVAVMDADLQHDETVLPAMLQRLEQEALDVVVGSRYTHGGSVAGWDQGRQRLSQAGTRLARRLLKAGMADLADPMSGFFVMRRSAFDAAVRRMSGEGYKVLLDLLLSAPQPLRCAEVPYRFRPRHAGESKLDSAVVWEHALLLLDKQFGRWVSARFLMFALVGASGMAVHFTALWVLHRGLGAGFGLAQGSATLLAMTSNYTLNNLLTYRDRRHRGARWWLGLLSFWAVCGIGAVANVGVATALFEQQEGWLLSGVAGAVVGTAWNYLATRAVTWKKA